MNITTGWSGPPRFPCCCKRDSCQYNSQHMTRRTTHKQDNTNTVRLTSTVRRRLHEQQLVMKAAGRRAAVGRHAVGRRAAARRVAAVGLLLGGLVQVAAGCWSAGCWSAGCWSAGCCRSAGYWRAGWSASWSAGCGRQAASRWAAGPRATGLAWRASVVGCSAGCLVAGCRWSAGGQSAGCRWLAGGCQSAGCWSRVATWHMWPTAAPKPQFFLLARDAIRAVEGEISSCAAALLVRRAPPSHSPTRGKRGG